MKNNLKAKQQSRRRFIKLAAAGTALVYSPVIGRGRSSEMPVNADLEKFFKACHDGKVDIVKNMLSADPRLLTAKDNQGRSGFAIALLAGHPNIGDFLKKSGYQTDLHESVLNLDWDRYNELVGEVSTDTVKLINADHPIGGTTMWAAAAGGAGNRYMARLCKWW